MGLLCCLPESILLSKFSRIERDSHLDVQMLPQMPGATSQLGPRSSHHRNCDEELQFRFLMQKLAHTFLLSKSVVRIETLVSRVESAPLRFLDPLELALSPKCVQCAGEGISRNPSLG